MAAVDEGLYLAAPAAAEADPSDVTKHSCDPTLRMTDAVTLVDRREVAAGEELAGDYAMREVDEGMVAARPSRCGSPLCRGRLAGRDRRLPELRARYRDRCSPFLNRRIAALAEGEPIATPAAPLGAEALTRPPPGFRSTRSVRFRDSIVQST